MRTLYPRSSSEGGAVGSVAVPALQIAIGPVVEPWAEEAVRLGGGLPVPLGSTTAGQAPVDGLVWLAPADVAGLRAALGACREARWVQLPFAGIEPILGAGILDEDRVWTCAKGSYAEPVAEHALALALAGLRYLPQRIRAHHWGEQAATMLWDEPVTIVGGGGITTELMRLLAPFRCPVTVVRRRAQPVRGAARTLPTDALHEALPGALVVFLALALTPETNKIIGPKELALMDRRAWLINVARGGHVDTPALLDALHEGEIAGAGLDVTDPEPLPDHHPLWDAPNCIITPHTADTWEIIRPRLAARITTNVARLGAGQPLEGLVDVPAGY